MPQTARLSRNNTTITSDALDTVITLYTTRVVVFNDKLITLDNGGHCTVTTATRMNQASNEYRLGFTVSRSRGSMYVTYNGKRTEFNRTITFKRV